MPQTKVHTHTQKRIVRSKEQASVRTVGVSGLVSICGEEMMVSQWKTMNYITEKAEVERNLAE